MDRKTFTLQPQDALKLASEGKAKVVFATLEVIDKDGDYTEKGAFGQQKAHLLPMHTWKDASTPFIGVANVYEEGNKAVADIEFNMELERAKDWRSSLKFALDHGVNIEWSYGYDVRDSERKTVEGKNVRALKSLHVIELSPVVVGAGEDTGTISVKEKAPEKSDGNSPESEGKSADSKPKAYVQVAGSWEQMQMMICEAARALFQYRPEYFCCLEATFPSTCIIGVYSYDSNNSEYYEYDWSLSPDGAVVLANEREVELEAVVQSKALRFADDHAQLVKQNRQFVIRAKALAALRQKEGRSLSRANRDRMTGWRSSATSAKDQLETLVSDIDTMLSETDSKPEPSMLEQLLTPEKSGADAPNLDALYAQFLETQTRLAGHLQ